MYGKCVLCCVLYFYVHVLLGFRTKNIYKCIQIIHILTYANANTSVRRGTGDRDTPPVVPHIQGNCVLYMYFVQMWLHIKVKIHMQLQQHNKVHIEKWICKMFTSNYTVKNYIKTSSCICIFSCTYKYLYLNM